MIVTDGTHLISTNNVTELHKFARSVGLKRCWFSNKRGKNQPHYDLHGVYTADHLVVFGAMKVDHRMLFEMLERSYKNG